MSDAMIIGPSIMKVARMAEADGATDVLSAASEKAFLFASKWRQEGKEAVAKAAENFGLSLKERIMIPAPAPDSAESKYKRTLKSALQKKEGTHEEGKEGTQDVD